MKKQQKSKLAMCTICGFMYEKKELAEQCHAWCKAHKSCNMDITKYAVKKKD